jgi:hypothetical protein
MKYSENHYIYIYVCRFSIISFIHWTKKKKT